VSHRFKFESHSTKNQRLNLSNLTGREGGPCPRSSQKVTPQRINRSTQNPGVVELRGAFVIGWHSSLAGTGSTFPTCEIAQVEHLFGIEWLLSWCPTQNKTLPRSRSLTFRFLSAYKMEELSERHGHRARHFPNSISTIRRKLEKKR